MTTPLGEALAARTEALCAVPSPIGEERALCDLLEARARERFARVRRVENSLVAMIDPADVPMNWTCPECGARKEDFEMVEL